ncbi:MAG TPA: UDP-N-acetylmuramate--L-alanine ligase, partial [Gemmatimonadales bacterium]|nr:UDP-N-acetylmuramate--L-alanine ligase [Gemmatimonadales bacterium]
MSALALLARRRGVAVTGCDKDANGAGGAAAAADVRRAGGQVLAGHDPSHVEAARAVVVSSAVPPDHPELIRARELGLPVVRRAEALAAAVSSGQVVAVAGTHGKTTTTVMATEALAAAGLSPTGIAGGRVSAWGGNARLGGDNLFIVEADEYDKSFLALTPQVAVINNVEPDHLECYGSVEALEEAFSRFPHSARRLIVGGDDPAALRVARASGRPTWTVGFAEEADFRVQVVERNPGGSVAVVRTPAGRQVELRVKVPGIHNVRNASAALAVCVELGAELEPVLGALAGFGGVGRRFEMVGEAAGVVVIDDYAHHEGEIAATLDAARQAYPERRLVAVFQPHLFSRTAEHGVAMGRALAAADMVVVTDIYAAREKPLPGVSGRMVQEAAEIAGADSRWVPVRDELAPYLAGVVRSGDLVVTMGAGDVTWVGRELIGLLGKAEGGGGAAS